MKTSTLAALALALGVCSFGAAQAAPNGNTFATYKPSGSGTNGLGNTVAAVPEPASWALMLVGVGLIGVVIRRRGAIKA